MTNSQHGKNGSQLVCFKAVQRLSDTFKKAHFSTSFQLFNYPDFRSILVERLWIIDNNIPSASPSNTSAVMSEIIPSFTFRCIRTPFSLSTSSTYSFPSLSVFRLPWAPQLHLFSHRLIFTIDTKSRFQVQSSIVYRYVHFNYNFFAEAVIFVFATGEILSTTPKTSTSSLMASPVILTFCPTFTSLYCIRLPWPLPLACQD